MPPATRGVGVSPWWIKSMYFMASSFVRSPLRRSGSEEIDSSSGNPTSVRYRPDTGMSTLARFRVASAVRELAQVKVAATCSMRSP